MKPYVLAYWWRTLQLWLLVFATAALLNQRLIIATCLYAALLLTGVIAETEK